MEETQAANALSLARSNTSATSHAAKRPRYTPVACDECKRRKIKCDGQTPCHRCAGHPTTCVYTQRGNNVVSRQETYVKTPDRDFGLTRSREMRTFSEKLSELQEQIDRLVASAAAGVPLGQQPQQHQQEQEQEQDDHQDPVTPVSASRSEQIRISASPHRLKRHNQSRAHRKARTTKHPQYMGPTSSAYSFGIARTSLQDMGINAGNNLEDNGIRSYSTTPARSPVPSRSLHSPREPLLSITQNEANRLVEIYQEELGTVYPFIDIKSVLSAAEQFYSSRMSTREASADRRPGDENMLSGGVLDILKLVIAIASVSEGHGPTNLSVRLLDNVESGFEGRLCGPSVDILEIQAWTLMSILQFHCDEEALAWRTIGLAARAAIELGLHHRDTYLFRFSDPLQRSWANKLFWCIYVLDRRWSFGTGLPFALHDDDIDPELPEESDPSSSLLKTMVAYGQIGSRVWKATSNLTASINTETQAFLDFQVRQWQSSIVPELQLHPDGTNMLDGHSRTRNRLRVLLYLRTNQMRLLIFRRALLSPKTVSSDLAGARKAVDIAKDTIRILNKLNKSSDIYASYQTSFNYFLVSALATILLAVCHATAQFNQSCREEFYLGLELVRVISSKSHVARRLWRTVRHLKVVGPKLGLFPTQEQLCERLDGPREGIVFGSSSGFTVPVTEHDLGFNYGANITFDSEVSSSYNFSLDGNELSNDLTALFETVDPSYAQPHQPSLNIPGDFDLYNYGTIGDPARSLLNLV